MAIWITGQLPESTLNCEMNETFSTFSSSTVTTSLVEKMVMRKNGMAISENTSAAFR